MKHQNRIPLWLSILVGGLGLSVISVGILVNTQNPIIFPTVLILSNYTVPISFATFFYTQRSKNSQVRLLRLLSAFVYGGVLGVLLSAFLEPLLISQISFFSAMIIGLIEEASKIIGVIAVTQRMHHDRVRDGIIVGVATGMGFASFENIGYSFIQFLTSGGNLSQIMTLIITRGFLSPIGHGLWTGILAGALFRSSKAYKFRYGIEVILAYLWVSFLHGLWDGLPLLIDRSATNLNTAIFSNLAVAVISSFSLWRYWRATDVHNPVR
jgi:RsiW-degrading membrane proteinase PrsW (M82 family)